MFQTVSPTVTLVSMATDARNRLVAAAEDLFYAEGIHAVGVEQLLSSSGVGRASFYRHFASKGDLVVAAIRSHGARWRRWLADEVAARGGAPLTVFDALADRFASTGFRGCAAINAMVEAADPDSPAHRAAVEHKQSVIDYLDGLLSAAGYGDHAALAEKLMLLVDGATVTALRRRDRSAAQDARAVAEALLVSSRSDHQEP
jgi:AcrR family transcriptional regulator